jgi:NAD(P)-dependent dehydrogenase (short-subunit alcohol dehydrogenase family)
MTEITDLDVGLGGLGILHQYSEGRIKQAVELVKQGEGSMVNRVGKGTAALVIGATQGIGLGFVCRLLQEPAIEHVYATYRALPSEALLSLAAREPERLTCLPLDITQESQMLTLVQSLQASSVQLAWVVNCVGILHEAGQQPEKSLQQLNADWLLRYFQVNSVGAVLLAKHLLPLLKHGERSIFATLSAKVGSIGDNQLGGWYGYRASKAALNMLIKTAALEYRRKSPNTILVLLHPGTTNTQLSQPFQRNVPSQQLFTVERTVQQLWAVLNGLESTDSGQFFSWDGSPLPW